MGIYEPSSILVYLTILPIQFFMMKHAWKRNSIILILLFTYMFVAIGIGSLMLYLDRGSISNVGTNHVGNFDFSYSYLFKVYIYLLVFQLIVLLIFELFNKTNSKKSLLSFITEETTTLSTRGKSFSVFSITVVAIVFALISIWMYNKNIGMIGLKQTQLPYHLSGILFYARRFVFTVVLIWMYAKTKEKGLATAILIAYALIVAVTGSSKSLNLILLVPVGIIALMTRHKGWGITAIVSSLLIYTYVSCTREIVYALDGEVSLAEVVVGSNAIFWSVIGEDFSYVTRLIAGVCESLYGMKNVVVAYQYNSLGIYDTLSYFGGVHLGSIIQDMPYELYGVTYSADKAFGVCVGFPGTMVMMSCRNIILLLFEAVVVSFILVIQDTILDAVVVSKKKRVYKYIVLLLFLFSFMSLIEANSLAPVYLCTVMMFLVSKMAKPNQKKVVLEHA